MQRIFSVRGPEWAGLVVVGATLGALACGAADSGLSAHTILGGALGGVLLPAAFRLRFHRLTVPMAARKQVRS